MSWRWRSRAFQIGTSLVVMGGSVAIVFAVLRVSSSYLRVLSSVGNAELAGDGGSGLSPLQAILARYPKAIELQAWARLWQAAAGDAKPNSDFELQDLQNRIEKSGVSASDRLRIASLLDKAGDINTAAIWARSGVFKADAELAIMAPDDERGIVLRKELIPLIEPLDKQQDPTTLERFWALQIPIPRESADDRQPEWRRIFRAQWLVYAGKAKDALADISSIHLDKQANRYTREEKDAIVWTEGFALFKDAQYARAEPLLQIVAHGQTPNAFEASSILVDIRMPKSPLAVLQSHEPRLIELEAWANQWQASVMMADKQGSADLHRLGAMISKSSLSATEELTIAKIIQNQGDMIAARIWVLCGVAAAERELAGASSNDLSAMPVMQRLEAIQEPLWEDSVNAGLQERITSLLERFDRVNRWDQRPEWARIGHGESLYRQCRYISALSEVELLSTDASKGDSNFTEEQKLEIHWLKGLVLFSLQRYNETVPELRFVLAPSARNPRQGEAAALLVIAQTRLGHLDEAQQACRDMVVRHLDSGIESAARSILSARIEIGEQ